MAPNQNDPSAPERAPGGGRDMPREKWQDDAWLPEGTPEMTDKTEWRAEQHPKFDVWRVVGDGMTISGLDKPTALKIAAVNEMEAALDRCLEYESDTAGMRGLSGYCTCILRDRASEKAYEAYRCPHQKGRAALAKARGGSDE